MQGAADNLEFELAADIRDRINELREEYETSGDEEASCRSRSRSSEPPSSTRECLSRRHLAGCVAAEPPRQKVAGSRPEVAATGPVTRLLCP